MQITQINTPELFNRAKDFLLPYEPSCVQLSSYVRKGSDNLFIITKDDSTVGLIYLKGTLLHCIPDFDSCAGEVTKVLSTFLSTHAVKCVNGSFTVSEKISAIYQSLGHRLAQRNVYNLMTLGEGHLTAGEGHTQGDEGRLPGAKCLLQPAPLSNDDEIRRMANPEHDSDILFELQKAYIKEEVVPVGKTPSDLEIRVILKQILKNQICLALFSDGEPVAKANTNAIGWKCVQVGGVYTHPLYRRNGYAQTLVSNLCARILRTGRTVTLYVKEKNAPAQALYNKLGFTTREKFEIAYFD